MILSPAPIDVTINALNKEVNSIYSDHSPFVTSDGQKLYFTSRRKDGMGNENEQSLDAYREDVYSAEFIDDNWYDVENIGVPINSETHDATVCLEIRPLFVEKHKGLRGNGCFHELPREKLRRTDRVAAKKDVKRSSREVFNKSLTFFR